MNWSLFLEQFHFMRPALLLLIPIGVLLAIWLRQQVSTQKSWNQVIDPGLLPHLLDNSSEQRSGKLSPWLVLLLWLTACIALAGPSWEQIKQPVIQKKDALVIILDLSLSMYAEDQKPSRLINARRKILDILDRREEGMTALVAYSGDAHKVSPLTNDTETIASMVPALQPEIMPKFGSNIQSAIMTSRELLQATAIDEADIIILTDQLDIEDFKTAVKPIINQHDFYILGFGTTSGAPIPLKNGFLKDGSDNTIIARLNEQAIQSMASNMGIKYIHSAFDNSDIDYLLSDQSSNTGDTQETEREFNQWDDKGYWLLLLILPFLVSFRRGWVLLLAVFLLPEPVYAFEWEDLWKTPDQRAMESFQQGEHEQAAETFESEQWKASANYRKGDYEAAAEQYANRKNPDAYYNRANALAKAGKLEEAIKAYEKALEKSPDFEDAQFNKNLVQQLLEQQQQQEQQDQSGEDGEQSQQNQQGDSDEQQGQQGDEQGQQQSQEGSQSDNQESKKSGSSSQQEQQDNSGQQGQSQNQDQQQQDTDKQQSMTEQDDEEEADKENRQPAGQAKEPQDEAENAQQQAGMPSSQTPLEKEQSQALQQWLRKIPDDPGMLLRNKFRYQYEQNRRQNEHLDKDSEQLW